MPFNIDIKIEQNRTKLNIKKKRYYLSNEHTSLKNVCKDF